MPEPSEVEIVSRTPHNAGFSPAGLIPEGSREHWYRLAARAHQSYRAAVELKCLDCCGWDRPEAKRCAIVTCALWAMNRRIFGPGVGPTEPRSELGPEEIA